MTMLLSDLRHMAQMAQFSERECRADVLRFIEAHGHLSGDAWVSMDKDSVQLVLEKTRIEAREVM